MQNNDFTFDPKRSNDEADQLSLKGIDPQGGLIKTWSYSSLTRFEECPYRVFLRYVKQIPEESGPQAERGTKIHDAAEKYVIGETSEMDKAMLKFEKRFEQLRQDYEDAKVQCEEEWAFTTNWEPTGWKAPDAWLRMKLDVFIEDDETSARVIDYKTGLRQGNELKHASQSLIYSIASFLRYPKLEFIKSEFWYLDLPDVMEKSYTREYAMMFFPKLDARAKKMTTETQFIARPSRSNCKWCYYGKNKICTWAEPI